MWISEPTNVTIRIITADSVSSRNASWALNGPASIQVYATWTSPAPPWPSWNCRSSGPNTWAAAIANDPTTAPIAIVWTIQRPNARSSLRPATRLISAPTSGSSGIKISRSEGSVDASMLVPERGEAIDLDVAAGAGHRDDDREAHRGLGCGHGDHDQREGVGRQIAPHAGERQQRDVGGVEHELDAHQDDQRVAAQQHADHADQEQHGGEHQEVRVADVDEHSAHPTLPSEWPASASVSASASPSGRSGRAIAIAPTTATSSRIEIASNGNSPAPNRSVPTAAIDPQSGRENRSQTCGGGSPGRRGTLSSRRHCTHCSGSGAGAFIAMSVLAGSTCASITHSR